MVRLSDVRVVLLMGFHVRDLDDDELEAFVLHVTYDRWAQADALEELKRRVQRRTRLEGWAPLGTHVDCTLPADRRLEFSEELDETGLPEWERVKTEA